MSERFIQVLQKRRLLDGDAAASPNITYNNVDAQVESEILDDDEVLDDDVESEVVYLDKEEMRHKFGLCQETRDITKKFTVRVCAFEIRHDDEDTQPFLLHAMQFDGVVFDFPQFTFQCASNVGDDSAVYFQNECLQHLSDFVEDIDDVTYRGFVLDQSSSSSTSTSTSSTTEVYVFYDIAGKKLVSTTTTPRVWVTVDEFLNVGFVLGHPVQASLPQFFLKHPHLIFLYQHGKRVYVPEVMFICDDDGNNGYVNLSPPDNQEVAFLDNRIPHDILGNFYIFSKFPLIADKFTWRRFVGFCQDNIYLTKPLPQRRQSNFTVNMSLGQVIPSVVKYVFDKEKGPTGPESAPDTGSETGFTGSDTGATGSETGLFSSMFSNTSSYTGFTGSETGSETGFTGSDTGATGSETGLFSSMFGNTVAEIGATGSETGATGSETGSTGSETGLFSSMFGNTTSDTGATGSETGSTGSETGFFSSMFGNTTSDPGATGSETGSTGSETGFFSSMFGKTTSDPGATGSETGSTGNNSLFKIFGGGSNETEPTEPTEPTDPAVEDDTNRLMSFLSDQTASCIYFQEVSSADEIIPFWCIKTDEYYVEI